MRVLIASLTLLLAACGFQPMYAPAGGGQAIGPVQVSQIDGKAGHVLKRELDRRIVRAAREVCGEASNVDLEGGNAVRQCREETIALAASQREQLLAAARSGSPIVVASAR